MQNVKNFIQKWAKKKRTYAVLLIIGAILFFQLSPKSDNAVTIDSVKQQNLESTVLATGEVTSSTDLSLSFNNTGIVKTMNVRVGSLARKGQVLATLDSGTLYGSLKSAQGGLKSAQARYDRLLAGTSNEEVNVAEVALANAERDLQNIKNTQDVIVNNAKKTVLNSSLEAYTNNNASFNTVAPAISGTYTGTAEGSYRITTFGLGTSDGGYFNVDGLSKKSSPAVLGVGYPLGDDGLYITFPLEFSTTLDSTWVVDIPNTDSSNYITNQNALNLATQMRANAVATAESLVNSRKAELALKKASARSFELDLAKADILSAEGQVESSAALYEKTVLRAPASGTITKVNYKLGELAEMQKEAVVLQDIRNLYVEANINESNIVKIKLGQKVGFSIDSFGPDVGFEGEVVHIDPSATFNDGIVNYKIKVSLDDTKSSDSVRFAQIKPGMNANLKILLAEKENVLVAPKLSIVSRDGKSYIRIVTDEKLKKYEEREVTTGLEGDGNLVEILSGASANEKIALVNENL